LHAGLFVKTKNRDDALALTLYRRHPMGGIFTPEYV